MSHHALGWVKGVANERKYVPGTLHSLIGPWLIRTLIQTLTSEDSSRFLHQRMVTA